MKFIQTRSILFAVLFISIGVMLGVIFFARSDFIDAVVYVAICLGPIFGTTILTIFFVTLSDKNLKKATDNILSLKNSLANTEIEASSIIIEKWTRSIPYIKCRNEIEVEMKFVAPMVSYLGYDVNNVDVRVPVRLKTGRTETIVEADWVLYNKNKKPFIVIEAKGPDQVLNDEVKEQGRSYAFGLNAPIYVLTNGLHLIAYRRNIEEDEVILSLSSNDFQKKWPKIKEFLSAKD